ncbi:MAG: HlyD family efflux transporter periplasmic adaptor subunit [Polyangiaceae bacterium]
MSVGRKILRAIPPILALFVGVAIMGVMIKTRPQAEKKAREERGALVKTAKVHSIRERVRVVEGGIVIPAEQITAQPEAAGRVVWQHPELVPGGRFKKGDVLVRIDARDYRLALRQQSANVNRAQLELKLESARKEIAKEEWAIIGEDQRSSAEGKALALREPQLEAAQANLEAAQSARAQAKLAVSKTTLRAPFNGFVKAEAVDIGQLVTPQTPLATLVGTDEFWVQVSVPVDRLGVMDIPGWNAKTGSKAIIAQEVAGQRVEREGKVVRLMGDLDPVGRMARVLVAIEDPFGLKMAKAKASESAPEPAGELPLLLGAYVEVAIEARISDEVIEVPRLALHDGDSVYVFGKDGRLGVRTVKVAWRRADTVLVREGLTSGEEVVVSRLPSAVPGMRLRKAPEDEKTVLGQK